MRCPAVQGHGRGIDPIRRAEEAAMPQVMDVHENRRSPRVAAQGASVLPPGADERIAGSGVMGLAFESGDYFSLRCMTPSFGDPYTAVWHRNPDEEWVVYTTTAPELSCERYIGAACAHPSVRTPIDVEWLDDWTLRVSVPGILEWTVALTTTPVTRAMSAAGRLMPHGMWVNRAVLAWMGRMAGPALGVGKVRLSGVMPNRQRFTAAPVEIWKVVESRATILDRDAGAPKPLPRQTRLGGFWLPQRGIFMCGFGHFENFDPERHVSAAAHNRELLTRTV
jgi:hypothetical protein